MSCVINEVPAAALNVGPVFDREVAHGCSSPRIAEHPQRTPSRILFAPFWRLLYVSRILFAVSQPAWPHRPTSGLWRPDRGRSAGRRWPRQRPRHDHGEAAGRKHRTSRTASDAARDPRQRVVLLTLASGRRRTEIAGLNVEDLDFGRSGFSNCDNALFVALPQKRNLRKDS
jgi:hypothetical protein